MNKIIVENDTMRFYSTPVPIPVGGSQWSKIFFMFSDEWEDLRKIAQFRQGELKRNVDIDSNNFCYVPNEMLPDMCGELSIVGYPQDTSSAVIATANSLMLNFVQGFESGGEPAVPPTPDLYQKLIKEFAESGGGNPDAVLYSKQELTDKQQKQARENITVTKSYQIPTRVSGNDLLVDGWATAAGGFDIVASDIEHGALPYFVADDCIFLCTGIRHSAKDSITFVSGTVDYSALARIVYKNAYWESGTSIIHIQTMEVSQHDIEERAQTEYFYVGSYGYIYGRHYEELAGDNPKYNIPKKYPFAVVDGKFNNAVLPLISVDEEMKQIVYARTDATPDGKFKIQGLIVGDNTTPLEVIDIDIPVYVKPVDGIPKTDLASDVQTSLAKADTSISYDSQTLTEAQQKQARANIGAGQPVFVVNVTGTVDNNYTADKTAAEIEAAYQAGRTIVCRIRRRFEGGGIPVELALVSRNQERVFIFYADQLDWTELYTLSVRISDSGVEVGSGMVEIYEPPDTGIPKTDLEQSVQTSLAKADTAISLGLTAATPGQIIKVKTVQDGKPTEWEAVDMPSGEEWEKVADIELRADTALYVLADFAVWRKAKVIMRRSKYVAGLNKNVWCRVVEKNNAASQYYSCGYLGPEYGYVYWDFSAEVSNNVISSATLRSNNIEKPSSVQSTQTLTPINLPPTAYELTLTFVDTSVIQDGDKVTVIGVRR